MVLHQAKVIHYLGGTAKRSPRGISSSELLAFTCVGSSTSTADTIAVVYQVLTNCCVSLGFKIEEILRASVLYSKCVYIPVSNCKLNQRYFTTMRDLSIVIPVYNDPEGIKTTLSSLTQQTVPKSRYEIIAVDNNSTDTTRDVIKDFTEKYDNVVLTTEERVQSSYAARNTGIKASQAEIIAFVDADMIVPNDWVDSVISEFQEISPDYMGCNVEVVAPEKTTIGKFNESYGFPINYYIQEMNFAPTCCLVVSRALLKDIGKFNASLISGGDSEFGRRAADNDYSMYFADNITMYHPARTTLKELISKGTRIGRGRAQKRRLREDPLLSLRDLLPPHPSKLRQRIGSHNGSIQFVLYYIIASLIKFSKLAGTISESIDK